MKDETLFAFLAGAIAGAALTWSLATASERVRRIRRDLRAARKGRKTLWKMLRREAGTLATIVGVVTLIVVIAASLLIK